MISLGKEVMTLVNEEKPAGVYEAKFGSINISSEIYFYRIEAEFIKTNKV